MIVIAGKVFHPHQLAWLHFCLLDISATTTLCQICGILNSFDDKKSDSIESLFL